MKNNRGKKRNQMPTKYTLLLISAGCIAVFITSLTLNLSGGPLHTLAGYVIVPMQSGINAAGQWVLDKANEFQTLSDVLDENEQLQAQVDELTDQLNSLALEQYELESLRELLELDEKYPEYEKVSASVVAMDSNNWFDTFTIDRGTSDGVTEGMNVMAGSGLVGIVTEAGANYSKVRSIIDDSSSVSAMVLTTGDNFIISGDLEQMNESGVIPFSSLKDDDDEVQVGDAVVTSYVSDKYQQGILIGYIASIEDSANQLTKTGTITPVVDFEHLQMVMVITDIKDTSEMVTTSDTETEDESSSDDSDDSEENTGDGSDTGDSGDSEDGDSGDSDVGDSGEGDGSDSGDSGEGDGLYGGE